MDLFIAMGVVLTFCYLAGLSNKKDMTRVTRLLCHLSAIIAISSYVIFAKDAIFSAGQPVSIQSLERETYQLIEGRFIPRESRAEYFPEGEFLFVRKGENVVCVFCPKRLPEEAGGFHLYEEEDGSLIVRVCFGESKKEEVMVIPSEAL